MSAEIGTSEETMTALVELDVPIEEPKFEYLPWEDTITLADNTERGIGFPLARWIFPYLEADWYNELKEFCPGATAHVYIRTKLSDDSYGSFEADMIWPNQTALRNMGLKPEITIEFRNLVALEEAS